MILLIHPNTPYLMGLKIDTLLKPETSQLLFPNAINFQMFQNKSTQCAIKRQLNKRTLVRRT
jgi:hypothetical protein